MKSIWGLCLIVISGILADSCIDAPQYSKIPDISFDNIIFKDVKDPSSADSLIISLKFKDGDGDLGLATDEVGCYLVNGKTICYNDKFYYKFNDGSLVNYKTKRTVAGYDTLPAFVTPYNCTNWEVITQDQKVLDTLYFELNPNHNNIFVTFQVQNGSGVFQDYDWTGIFTYPQCEVSGFNGRFPVLAKDLTQPGPLEGTIRYGMTSVGFNIIFSIKLLRLKVVILDRALNKSNEIVSDPFTLQSRKVK